MSAPTRQVDQQLAAGPDWRPSATVGALDEHNTPEKPRPTASPLRKQKFRICDAVGCGCVIERRNKTGFCREHVKAIRAEHTRRWMQDPDNRAKALAAFDAARERCQRDPAFAAHARRGIRAWNETRRKPPKPPRRICASPDCGARLHPRNEVGFCIRCAAERVCAEPGCGRKLCRRTMGEYCVTHAAQRQANAKWADPVYRARRSEAMRNALLNPDRQAIMRAGQAEYWRQPENRAARKRRMERMHADPEFRAKIKAALWDRADENAENRIIAQETRHMRGLDDEALMVFCAARDDGLTMWAARQDALMDMEERGLSLPRGPLVISRVPRGRRLRVEVAA